MEKLLLTKNGRILKKGQEVQGNPLVLLSGLVELEPGFTLASFFKMIFFAGCCLIFEYPVQDDCKIQWPRRYHNFKT